MTSSLPMLSPKARLRFESARAIAVLTGAGVSAESGIPTFRSASGLWRNYRPTELASPAAYARDPQLVWDWYKVRLDTVLQAEPSEAHKQLANLDKHKTVTLITQNVDGLHQRAGQKRVLELHGNLTKSRCESCGQLDTLTADTNVLPFCSSCHHRARPNVVWFGESLPQDVFNLAIQAFSSADLALIIGTSGVVEPAASLARLAKDTGAFVIEVNPEATPLSTVAHFSLKMTASKGMKVLLEAAT